MELECPAQTTLASEPWGKAGWLVYCDNQGNLHGPWLAAEAGKLAIRGEYFQGERTGPWEWYDEEGKVAKRVTYESAAVEHRQGATE